MLLVAQRDFGLAEHHESVVGRIVLEAGDLEVAVGLRLEDFERAPALRAAVNGSVEVERDHNQPAQPPLARLFGSARDELLARGLIVGHHRQRRPRARTLGVDAHAGVRDQGRLAPVGDVLDL